MNKKRLLSPNLILWGSLTVLGIAVAALVVPTFPAPRASAAEATGGQAVFMAQKCNLCHGIESLGIASKATSEKTKGPDLSAVGAEHDAAWIGKFLHREEKVDGKVHKKDLSKATDADIETLATWLATLKKK